MTAKTIAPTPDRLLRRPAVETMTGLSRSAIYRMIPEGRFPKPVRIDGRSVAWKQSTVQEWMAQLS